MALILGPILFLTILLLPLKLDTSQQHFLAIFLTVVYYWLFSNIPLFITGFIGICLTSFLNIAPATKLFSNFGHPIIFLFLGGFLLAKAFNNVGLDQRISLYLLTRKFINGSLIKLLFVLMLLTSVFTMWISNTATTAMMLPLVLGTLKSLKIEDKKVISIILICIAYSSSIGGIATPIGSTPNIIALGLLDSLANINITFLEWIKYALPISIAFLLMLFILVIFKFKNKNIEINNSYLVTEYKKLPTFSSYEKITLMAFLLTVSLWLVPSFLKLANIKLSMNFNSGIVAILGASILFIFPLNAQRKILIVDDLKKIDWSSLMLFGCGLAFGKILFDLGLAKMASDWFLSLTSGLNLFMMLFIIFSFVIFSTELSSNTATANIILPIMITTATTLNLSPLFLSMGVAISCSLAFMLPVATPPNAIVYGSEKVDKTDMIQLGFGLNILFAFILAMAISLYQVMMA